MSQAGNPDSNPDGNPACDPDSDLDGHFAARLEQLEDSIAAACRAAARPRAEVELMAASKTHPVEAMLAAQRLGLTLFGENRVQEFAGKSAALPRDQRAAMRVHLIGHLQGNKAARAAELFDGIDSLDSLSLAERLNTAANTASNTAAKTAARTAAERAGKRLPVLVEIKLSDEASKTGLAPDARELADLLERLPALSHLDPQGLMTIAPLGVGQDQTRACFRQLRQLRDSLSATHPRLDLRVLSMGMSGDFALAIAEGATRIRVGTALFGARATHSA